jgi:carboxylesterase type B
MMKLKTPSFRAILDNTMISEHLFAHIHSGEFARRFHARGMKLLIGEVEHEEAMYSIGAPTTQDGLLPSLQNYYRASVAETLMDHYKDFKSDVVRMFTTIVTDVQVRATTRAFSKALYDGGVPIADIFRYRISLPIKAENDFLPEVHYERFKDKVVHSFDFLHWWFARRVGFTKAEEKAIREWLIPFGQFVKGEDVSWGTSDIAQFRHLTEDARVEIVQDPHWPRLMDTASVLKKIVEV